MQSQDWNYNCTATNPVLCLFAALCKFGENLALGRSQDSGVMLCAAGLPAQLTGIEKILAAIRGSTKEASPNWLIKTGFNIV